MQIELDIRQQQATLRRDEDALRPLGPARRYDFCATMLDQRPPRGARPHVCPPVCSTRSVCPWLVVVGVS